MDSNMSCITVGQSSELIGQHERSLETKLMHLEERLKAMEKILTIESHCRKADRQEKEIRESYQRQQTGLLAVPPAGL
jgi:hypothetical protein